MKQPQFYGHSKELKLITKENVLKLVLNAPVLNAPAERTRRKLIDDVAPFLEYYGEVALLSEQNLRNVLRTE